MAVNAQQIRIGDVDLFIETVSLAGTEATSGTAAKAQQSAIDAFERAQDAIVAVASKTVSAIGRLRSQTAPSEVEVKFGLKVSAKGDIIIAGVSGETTLEVKLLYRTSEV